MKCPFGDGPQKSGKPILNAVTNAVEMRDCDCAVCKEKPESFASKITRKLQPFGLEYYPGYRVD